MFLKNISIHVMLNSYSLISYLFYCMLVLIWFGSSLFLDVFLSFFVLHAHYVFKLLPAEDPDNTDNKSINRHQEHRAVLPQNGRPTNNKAENMPSLNGVENPAFREDGPEGDDILSKGTAMHHQQRKEFETILFMKV